MSDQLSEVFWGMFITTIAGIVLGLARMAYKSKCKEVSCGCMRIIRDTQTEEKEFEITAIHSNKSNEDI